MNIGATRENIRFIVVSEGGIPVYSYPREGSKRENLFSFFFGALTSLGEEIWGEGGTIRIEKGEKFVIADKRGGLFFSFITESKEKNKKISNLLEHATEEFISQFGSTLDQVTLIQKEKKDKFTSWLKDQLDNTKHIINGLESEKSMVEEVLGKKAGFVVKKTETREFTFRVEDEKVSQNQFVLCVDKEDRRRVLARVDKIERQTGNELATCSTLRIIQGNQLKPVGRPVCIESPVYVPSKEILSRMFYEIPRPKRILLGSLMNAPRHIPVYYNLKDFSTHLFIVASTGGGKSYTLGVLIEGVLECSKEESDTALLIFDFHNEFGGLTFPNQDTTQIQELTARNLSTTDFRSDLFVFNWKWNPIKLKPTFTPDRLKFLSDMPEEYALYLQNLMNDDEQSLDLATLEERVKKSDLHHARKRAMESRIEGLRESDLFSEDYFPARDIIDPGKATLIQLGNMPVGDWAVRFIVADLLRDIYQAKLTGEIKANLILFLDEAHKFAPQSRDDPLGKIIHTITREGRKLGLWLVLSTQTSRDLSEAVMKNCNSILALRSPKRQTQVLARIYGIDKENTEMLSELSPGKGYLKAPSLPFPLMVDIRPRKTSEMPRKGEIKDRIRQRVRKAALLTKERLLYTKPLEEIQKYVSDHKRFTVEDISAALPLSVENVQNFLTEMSEKVVTSSTGFFYSQWYWEELREKIKSLLEERGKIHLEELQTELNLPPADGRRLLGSLEGEKITENVWYSTKELEKQKRKIKKLVNEQEKVATSELSEMLSFPYAEVEKLLTYLKDEVIRGPSDTLYSPSFWEKKKKESRIVLEEKRHLSHLDLVEKLGIPAEDLKCLVETLPLTHLYDQQHWYWEPKLEDVKEDVSSFSEEREHFTLEDVGNKFNLPRADVEALVEELDIQESPPKQIPEISEQHERISHVIIERINSMPSAARHIIKVLLKNEGKIPAARALSLVSEETLSYLKQIDLLSTKYTNRGKFILLRLDLFLKNHFGVNPTQKFVNAIAWKLYRQL
ncbi:MAG: DUF87 domain-containing protein [Candidatus Korarchaeota archaeon]|nr:DUF87 domain-containing protein [Candidatus Korarchaeota archaeon]NIU81996.1 DUF87 domain-containing protein [Candidatus Thorarchaeota archaeon]NIW15163.1 DUF87 domain-containing protein [Candidatus Thorarchaeota archaeon]NIW53153.1 DUF87 domain-containing protein [Candidatus Korarchaeota archaeon]